MNCLNQITITTDLDGGNPRDSAGIERTGPDAFRITPFSEDGDPDYKFRLEVIATNHSPHPREIELTIDWQEPVYQQYRDYVYLGGPGVNDWRSSPCQTQSTQSVCSLQLLPGKAFVSLQPRYTYQDYLSLIRSIESGPTIKKQLLGRTPEDREIWCLILSRGVPRSKRRLVVVSRVHPYETGGSYAAEGIIEFFQAEPAEEVNRLLGLFDLYLIPMANPDGVYNGLAKRTSRTGIDLSKQVDPTDPTCQIIKEAIDKIAPHLYVEFHTWMLEEFDGIYDLNFFQCRRFIRNMPSQKAFGKKWRPMLRKRILSHKPHGFKRYCRDRFNAVVACFEYPWLNRTTLDMRKIGVDTIIALSHL
jgi:hypothetical protein